MKLWLIRLSIRLSLALSLVLATGAPVAAAPSHAGIAMVKNTAAGRFPDRLTFHLEAWSDANILKAKLLFQIVGSSVVEEVPVSFSSSDRISIDYALNLKEEYLPPGATLHYRWHLEDA